METLLGGLVFAAFLLAQIAAVIGVRSDGSSNAHEAIRSDRDASMVWNSAK
jgi:hypothetical protein